MARGATGGGEQETTGDVLFEWRVIGDQVRVAAIDPLSGTEVVVFGPAAGMATLKSLAERKLLRRLAQLPSDRC